MLYLSCTTITSVDLAHYGVSRAKDWVSVDCGTVPVYNYISNANLSTKYFALSKVYTDAEPRSAVWQSSDRDPVFRVRYPEQPHTPVSPSVIQEGQLSVTGESM